MLLLVGLVSHNALINTQNMKPTSPNKQSVLVPVRLGNNSYVITFDYKQAILAYFPKLAHIINFVQIRLGNIYSVITFNRNINRLSWPTSPYKLSSFYSVRLPVKLGNINSEVQYK